MCDCTVVNKDAKINLMYNMSISEINFCRSTKFIYAKKEEIHSENCPSISIGQTILLEWYLVYNFQCIQYYEYRFINYQL